MGRWAEFFELLAGEDIDGDEMDLGVTVLTSLGGGHINDLARAVLDANEAVLSQGRTLHGVSGRGASVGGLEGVFMLRIISHLEGAFVVKSVGGFGEYGGRYIVGDFEDEGL